MKSSLTPRQRRIKQRMDAADRRISPYGYRPRQSRQPVKQPSAAVETAVFVSLVVIAVAGYCLAASL